MTPEARLSAELLHLLGAEAFLRLVEVYGGTRLSIPADDLTRIIETVGEPSALRLAKSFGGSSIRVPLARDFRARHYREAGLSNAQIARHFGMTETGVDKLFRRMENRPKKGEAQLKLFG